MSNKKGAGGAGAGAGVSGRPSGRQGGRGGRGGRGRGVAEEESGWDTVTSIPPSTHTPTPAPRAVWLKIDGDKCSSQYTCKPLQNLDLWKTEYLKKEVSELKDVQNGRLLVYNKTEGGILLPLDVPLRDLIVTYPCTASEPWHLRTVPDEGQTSSREVRVKVEGESRQQQHRSSLLPIKQEAVSHETIDLTADDDDDDVLLSTASRPSAARGSQVGISFTPARASSRGGSSTSESHPYAVLPRATASVWRGITLPSADNRNTARGDINTVSRSSQAASVGVKRKQPTLDALQMAADPAFMESLSPAVQEEYVPSGLEETDFSDSYGGQGEYYDGGEDGDGDEDEDDENYYENDNEDDEELRNQTAVAIAESLNDQQAAKKSSRRGDRDYAQDDARDSRTASSVPSSRSAESSSSGVKIAAAPSHTPRKFSNIVKRRALQHKNPDGTYDCEYCTRNCRGSLRVCAKCFNPMACGEMVKNASGVEQFTCCPCRRGE